MPFFPLGNIACTRVRNEYGIGYPPHLSISQFRRIFKGPVKLALRLLCIVEAKQRSQSGTNYDDPWLGIDVTSALDCIVIEVLMQFICLTRKSKLIIPMLDVATQQNLKVFSIWIVTVFMTSSYSPDMLPRPEPDQNSHISEELHHCESSIVGVQSRPLWVTAHKSCFIFY